MTEKQIPQLVGILVEHQSFFGALSTENGQWAIRNPKKAIALFVSAVANQTEEVTQKLLDYVTAIKTVAIEKFVAADHFKAGETADGVKIAFLSDNFKKLFLPKTEEDVEAADIKVHRLTRNSQDLGIRAEIGEANEEIKLAHLWQVLKAHRDGKVGDWFVGYIIGTDGKLWAVSAYWCRDGWYLDAVSVEHPSPWCAGRRVCSR
jgi:hypothetical protein